MVVALFLTAGCAADPVVGPIDDTASVALITFEDQGDDMAGVVYRKVPRLAAFLAASEQPVLVVFYDRRDPANALMIPHLEQMADDDRGRLQIIWIDADAETDIARSFKVSQLPQFTVVEQGAIKRSLVGFADDGAAALDDLLSPYLEP
jgi:thioredoxin 1